MEKQLLLEFNTVQEIAERMQALLIKRPFTLIKSPIVDKHEIHRGLWLTSPVLSHKDANKKEFNMVLILADNLKETDKVRLELKPKEGNVVFVINSTEGFAFITVMDKFGAAIDVYIITVDTVEPVLLSHLK